MDVTNLKGGLVDDSGNETVMGRYLKRVEDKSTDSDIEEKSNILKVHYVM